MPKGIRTSPIPPCPECESPMTLRQPRPNQYWPSFWSCTNWPDCDGKRQIDGGGNPEGVAYRLGKWVER